MPTLKLTAKGLVFALCCIVDACVLRTTWTGLRVTEGQFRRGYFEKFGGEVGLAVDNTIRPVFPEILLTDRGELAVPPGMTAVATLEPGAAYDLACDSTLAPYVVIGAEAPGVPVATDLQLLPGEGRLAGGRTLSLQDGRLALVAWDPTRPWREDTMRLSALRSACAAPEGATALTVNAVAGRLDVHIGRCSLTEPLPSPTGPAPLLAALAGPDSVRILRQHGWNTKRWIVWRVLAAIVVKVATIWWGVGLGSAAAVSAVLGCTSLRMPTPTILTWPLGLIIGLVAATLRASALVLGQLSPRKRALAAFATMAVAACVVWWKTTQPRSFPPIRHIHEEHSQPDACALLGYSSVADASLRRTRGGMYSFLSEGCTKCQGKAGALAAGGERLTWVRDAYCASPPSFGAGGQVMFFGGANDDFLWGVLWLARLMIVSQQGFEPWHRSQAPAAAASLAQIDTQTSALDGLMRCVRSRGARFLFFHDFLVTDMVAGRAPARATMLARRRAAVEAAGGTFVDLFDVFGAEAGISWFNDYVHPSRVAHEHIADLLCSRLS